MRLQFAFLLAAATCCCLVANTNAERKRYDNYHAYDLTPSNLQQLAVVQQLESDVGDYVFLSAVHYVGAKIKVVVAPQQVESFLQTLSNAGITYELTDENIQTHLENDEMADPKRRDDDYTWLEYHELEDTYKWLHKLEADYPKLVKVFEYGKTFEGRQLLGIKISFGPGKKAIFIEGGMHAREWIGPAATTFIANELLTSKNQEDRVIAENFDWYFVPHANPDGFVYTYTDDRMWRKTRQPHSATCWGADPNRNWGFHWMEVGASSNPCSDTYGGPKAFSEPETRALADLIATEKGNIFLYLSLHSYSQYVLFPYGHTKDLPKNYDDLKRVMDVAISAISQRYGTVYTGGNVYDHIYPAAGASQDYVYGELGVNYSYCYELRPRNTIFGVGFKLPAEQIIPASEETFDGLKAMIKEIGISKFF